MPKFHFNNLSYIKAMLNNILWRQHNWTLSVGFQNSNPFGELPNNSTSEGRMGGREETIWAAKKKKLQYTI
jgi:hypothetical protein